MKFLFDEEFLRSVSDLYNKGGKFQKAATAVQAVMGRASGGGSLQDVFKGLVVTNHGESRIDHCVKYDLTGFARLVTVNQEHVCVLLFAGDHDATDRWLERNRGRRFVFRKEGETAVVETVKIAGPPQGDAGTVTGRIDFRTGSLVSHLPERYWRHLSGALEDDTRRDAEALVSISTDSDIEAVCLQVKDSSVQNTLMEVLLALRAGDVVNAKVHIDLHTTAAKPLTAISDADADALESGTSVVVANDVDPELFDHFVKTASFEKWMLYLHPKQREHVQRDFNGSARLAGVSGSGKTCVVVHRALRLARVHSDQRVLLVTLSGALAGLLNRLIDAQCGELRPKNLRVVSIFDLCQEMLFKFDPSIKNHLVKKTVVPNAFAQSEHVDEVWREYFYCENNNNDAEVLSDLVKHLNARGVYANDYIRQEFDYIRSAFSPDRREDYLKADRHGRIVPLLAQSRQQALAGLQGWEAKMAAVGVIDDLGIVAALHKHLHQIDPEYRCVLVDEAQDLGTLELAILRKLVPPGENDLFLCGDAAQTIHTKLSDLKAAGITLASTTVRLDQNYRNSKEILQAAHTVLRQSIGKMPKDFPDLDVLAPEFASFSSPKPLILKGASVVDEVARGISFLVDYAEDQPETHRYCLVLCGFGQRAIEVLGDTISWPVLSSRVDVRSARMFLSDLEQTKGFEFDAVVIVNCNWGTIPHPNLPEEESFRDLCRLYVAMTRAKTQLAITYSGQMSTFLDAARACFTEANLDDYAEPAFEGAISLPPPDLPELLDQEAWGRHGKGFLRSRDAVGLDLGLQDEILDHVTGQETLRGPNKKQIAWKTFGGFINAMVAPKKRFQILSSEAWERLEHHVELLKSER